MGEIVPGASGGTSSRSPSRMSVVQRGVVSPSVEAILSLQDPEQVGDPVSDDEDVTIHQLALGSLWRQSAYARSHMFQGGAVTEGLLRRVGNGHCVICGEELMIGDRLAEVTSKNAFHHDCFRQWIMEKTPEFFSSRHVTAPDFRMGEFELSLNHYSQVPWEEDSPTVVMQRCVAYCKALNRISETGKKALVILREHDIHSTLCSIYFSNLIEEKGLNFCDTYALCRQVLIGDYVEDIHSSSTDRASRKEVVQHAKAFMFLKLELVENSKPLSESIIQEAHSILMEGMCREDGVDASPGIYRSTSCCAGNQVFTMPDLIPSTMERILARYDSERRSLGVDPFYLAIWLSYEFVMCHPFVDGNGRMSRLLLSMSLMASGIPFPISFGFSKHKRAKRHYIQCLRKASTHGGRPTRLAYLVLSAFQDSAASFFESIRISVPEEYPKELLEEYPKELLEEYPKELLITG